MKKKQAAEKQPKTKQCRTCKGYFPADNQHFEFAGGSADRLTHDCIQCRTGVKADTKVCKGCKKPLPKDKEHFYLDRATADGFAYICKTCESERQYKKRGVLRLTLDLTKHPGVYNGLEQMAQEQLRTVEAQALWLIKASV